MNYTENYNLRKPTHEDFAEIDDLNENADIIDGILKQKADLDSSGKLYTEQIPTMPYIPTSQKGVAGGIASLGSNGKIPNDQLPSMDYIPNTQKGEANGVASLGSNGKVPASQLNVTAEQVGAPTLINGLISTSNLPTIPTSKGGTGSTTVAGARSNLSVYSKSEVDGLLSTTNAGVNLLDNWYFIGGGSQQGKGQFPINQRGQTSYTAAGYTIDRWTIPTAYHTLTLESDCLKIVSSADFIGLFQYFPAAPLLGRKVTFSILAQWNGQGSTAPYCTFYKGDGTYEGGGVLGTDKAIYSWQTTFPSSMPTSDPKFGVDIVSMTGTTLYIYAVKLEIGDTQTLAREENGQWVLNDPPPNYALELAKCNMSLADTSDSYGNFPFLHIESGSYVGTGTKGYSNPNSLTFSFAPKLIWCADAPTDFGNSSYVSTIFTGFLTTEYQRYTGFGWRSDIYGKKSSDGKTITWYYGGNSSDANYQFNYSGRTYYYTAIG